MLKVDDGDDFEDDVDMDDDDIDDVLQEVTKARGNKWSESCFWKSCYKEEIENYNDFIE